MSISEIVYESMESVTGIPMDELKEISDLPVFENDILDSLSLAEMLTLIEGKINKRIDLKKINLANFSTIKQIIATIESLWQ